MRFSLPFERRFQLNVTLVESNMPTLWQVQAAELAEESYELQTSNSGRLQMISELFTTYHPYWYWDVALNATFVYHSSTQYYLNLTVNADSLYIFSTT